MAGRPSGNSPATASERSGYDDHRGYCAERIGQIASRDLPPEAISWAKTAISDTVGVTLADAREPCTAIVDRIVTGGGSHGDCLIFDTNRRAPPLDVALINDTAAHALDVAAIALPLSATPV